MDMPQKRNWVERIAENAPDLWIHIIPDTDLTEGYRP